MGRNGPNSKSEIDHRCAVVPDPKRAQSTNAPLLKTRSISVLNIRAAGLGFISDFEFRISCFVLVASFIGFGARADDSYAQNAARIQQMTPNQKDDLRRKKNRFDELTPEEQQKLRDLHVAITSDPNTKELIDTLTQYNRWLKTLDSEDRSTLPNTLEKLGKQLVFHGYSVSTSLRSVGLCASVRFDRSFLG